MNQNNTFLWKMLMLRPPEASRGITALETQRTERINEQLLCWSIISLNKYCIILFFFFFTLLYSTELSETDYCQQNTGSGTQNLCHVDKIGKCTSYFVSQLSV